MTFYSSSEGPDPTIEASWREYRRWRAAQRRRRWVVTAAGLVGVVAGAALLWPHEVHRDTAAGSAALAQFDAPGRSGPGTVVVTSNKPIGVPVESPAPMAAEREVIAALTTPPPLPATADDGLVPPQDGSAPSPPPAAEASGSAMPPPEPFTPEAPLPRPKPMEAAGGSTASAKSVAPPPDRAPHLQLASFRTEAKAKSVLEQLRKEQSDLLGALEARVQRTALADGRVVYRVETGPLSGVAEAKRICAELQRRRLDCRYVQ